MEETYLQGSIASDFPDVSNNVIVKEEPYDDSHEEFSAVPPFVPGKQGKKLHMTFVTVLFNFVHTHCYFFVS